MRRVVVLLALAVACSSQQAQPPPAPQPPAPRPPSSPPIDAAVALERPSLDAAEPPVDAGPQALPKNCAADSPVDAPCTSYGGTYKISLRPRDGERCLLKKSAEARITISGANAYRGIGQAGELAPLARAIGKPKSDLRIGADVRDGVCCIDLEISPQRSDSHVRVKMARGANVVSAKAKERVMKNNDMCDAELDVSVELVRE